MYDASDYAVGVVLGQRVNRKPHVIYYASHTLNEAQLNYTVTEKEFLAVVFGFEKVRPYLIGSHVIVHIDHVALKHLFSKKDAKPRLLRWIFLLLEFDCEIRDRKVSKNLIVGQLSHIIVQKESESTISECFPYKQLLMVQYEP